MNLSFLFTFHSIVSFCDSELKFEHYASSDTKQNIKFCVWKPYATNNTWTIISTDIIRGCGLKLWLCYYFAFLWCIPTSSECCLVRLFYYHDFTKIVHCVQYEIYEWEDRYFFWPYWNDCRWDVESRPVLPWLWAIDIGWLVRNSKYIKCMSWISHFYKTNLVSEVRCCVTRQMQMCLCLFVFVRFQAWMLSLLSFSFGRNLSCFGREHNPDLPSTIWKVLHRFTCILLGFSAFRNNQILLNHQCSKV